MTAAPMDLTFAAMADPTRRAILERLCEGPATVGQLAEPFDVSQQAISKHVAVLRKAGLLRQEKVGRVNQCSFDPEPLQEASDWIECHRNLWMERFQKIDGLLRARRGGAPRGKRRG